MNTFLRGLQVSSVSLYCGVVNSDPVMNPCTIKGCRENFMSVEWIRIFAPAKCYEIMIQIINGSYIIIIIYCIKYSNGVAII